MNYINFEQNGGFPLSTDILSFAQSSYQLLEEISDGFGTLYSLGDAIVINGCTDNGISLTDGLLYVYTDKGKEVIPFEGGIDTGFYTILETSEEREFYDGICRDVMFTRKCVLTSGSTTYLTSNIQRPDKNTSLTNKTTNLIAQTTNLITQTTNLSTQISNLTTQISGLTTTVNNLTTKTIYDSVPIGVILMWTGYAGLSLPDGWALCDGGSDGVNSRPDMREKFIVGYHPNISDYDTYGKTGGTNYVTLSSDQLPRHKHLNDIRIGTDEHADQLQMYLTPITLTPQYGDYTVGNTNSGANNNGYRTGYTSSYLYDINGNQIQTQSAIENRPLYFVVAYIIKISNKNV